MRAFQQAAHGVPDIRNAPQTVDFTARGQTFTADVKADPDGGSCATVRGRVDCFTEADTLPELRKALAEVAELMIFGAGERTARYRISRPKPTGDADGATHADARAGQPHSEETADSIPATFQPRAGRFFSEG